MKKAPRRPKPAALGADSPTSSRVVHSARILGDACEKFQNYCIDGIELDIEHINQYVDRSLMRVSALSPVIGYDNASAIAHDADRSGRTLREAALDSGAMSAEDFDRIVNPANMGGPFLSVLVEQRSREHPNHHRGGGPGVVGVRRAQWCRRRVGCVASGARRGLPPGR